MFMIFADNQYLACILESLNGIEVQVFFEKNIEEKHSHRHDKN